MIAIFGDQNMGNKARAGLTPFNGQRGHLALDVRIASFADKARLDMAHHLEGGRNIIQYLGHRLAIADEVRPTTDRTLAGCLVGDGLARQMIRQRLSRRFILASAFVLSSVVVDDDASSAAAASISSKANSSWFNGALDLLG